PVFCSPGQSRRAATARRQEDTTMSHRTLAAAVALAAALASAPAMAQEKLSDCFDYGAMGQGWGHAWGQGWAPGGGSGMMGQGMMGQGGQGAMMGMPGMGPGRFVEGRIAFLEAELDLSDDQRPLFE